MFSISALDYLLNHQFVRGGFEFCSALPKIVLYFIPISQVPAVDFATASDRISNPLENLFPTLTFCRYTYLTGVRDPVMGYGVEESLCHMKFKVLYTSAFLILWFLLAALVLLYAILFFQMLLILIAPSYRSRLLKQRYDFCSNEPFRLFAEMGPSCYLLGEEMAAQLTSEELYFLTEILRSVYFESSHDANYFTELEKKFKPIVKDTLKPLFAITTSEIFVTYGGDDYFEV